jgi:Tol biopolymer transport system component
MYVAEVVGDSHEPRPLPSCPDCQGESPTWSPDGQWISFLRPDGLYRVGVSGGAAQRVAAIPHPTRYAWSPDSTTITSDARDGLYIVDLSSAVPTSRHVVRQRAYEGPGAPTWSPDGKRIAWFSTPRTKRGYIAQLWTADQDGGHVKLLRDFGCCVSEWKSAVWSPDGGRLAFSLELDDIDPRVYVLASDSGDVVRTFPGYGPLSWR